MASPPPPGMPESRLQNQPWSTTNWPRRLGGGREEETSSKWTICSSPQLPEHLCSQEQSHLANREHLPNPTVDSGPQNQQADTQREAGHLLPTSLRREPRPRQDPNGFTLHILFFLLLSSVSMLICHSLSHTGWGNAGTALPRHTFIFCALSKSFCLPAHCHGS